MDVQAILKALDEFIEGEELGEVSEYLQALEALNVNENMGLTTEGVTDQIITAISANPEVGIIEVIDSIAAPPAAAAPAPAAAPVTNTSNGFDAEAAAKTAIGGDKDPDVFRDVIVLPGLTPNQYGEYFNPRNFDSEGNMMPATQAEIDAAFAERDRLNNIAAQADMQHEAGTGRAYWIDIDGKRNYYYNEDGAPATQYDKIIPPAPALTPREEQYGLDTPAAKAERTFEKSQGAADRLSDANIAAANNAAAMSRLNTEIEAEYAISNADRAATYAAINAGISKHNAEMIDNGIQRQWLKDKFAVETALGRDKLALQTEVALENAMRAGRELEFQYGQLQQQARQFNATAKIEVDMENARRKELQQARRSQLASQIGQLAQDAGSRGALASTLLANPNLGLLSESLAGGQDFFTEESLTPLSDLLRQREGASQDPNLATFDPIEIMDAPDIPDPQFTMPPDQYNLPQSTSTGPTMTREQSDTLRADIKAREDAAAAARASAATAATAAAAEAQAEADALADAEAAAEAQAAALAEIKKKVAAAGPPAEPIMEPAYDTEKMTPGPNPYTGKAFGGPAPKPKTPFALPSPAPQAELPEYAGGGLAQSAYIGDEKGPELHIPLGPGEALVIPHDKVESFLRSASRSGALGNANALPKMAGGGKVKSQRQVSFLLSKDSPLTAKQRARLKKELKTGDVKIPRMEKGGKFPEDTVAGMGISPSGLAAALKAAGLPTSSDSGRSRIKDEYHPLNIHGDPHKRHDATWERLKARLTGTPWQTLGDEYERLQERFRPPPSSNFPADLPGLTPSSYYGDDFRMYDIATPEMGDDASPLGGPLDIYGGNQGYIYGSGDYNLGPYELPLIGRPELQAQHEIDFLLSKDSPLTAKQQARLKKDLEAGDVKIRGMEKGGKFPEDAVAANLVGMGIRAMADGGMFDQGTIFGTAKPADQTQTRNFLRQSLRRALTGTPWQGRGRAPTPVEVSAPGTDPMVRELAASLSALGTGTPQDVFLRRAAALSPRGIAERAGGVRRTA